MALAGPILGRRGEPLQVHPVTYVSWRQVVLNDPCPYCVVAPPPVALNRGQLRMSLEHVEPISRGGVNAWSNLVGAHQGCNLQRGNRSLLRYVLFRHLMSALRGKKGTPTRMERRRFRKGFFGLRRAK